MAQASQLLYVGFLPPNLFFLASLQLFFSCRILSIVAWFLLISPNSHSFKTPISCPCLLIPPLTLPIPILLGFHTCVRPHFSISKIRRGGSKFRCKILKVAWMEQLLTFCMHSLWFFFHQFALSKREQLCKAIQIFLKKFYLEISSHCLIVLVWSMLGKLYGKAFQ